jgi:hypothetical protein
VVELSRPEEISFMNRAFAGPTSITWVETKEKSEKASIKFYELHIEQQPMLKCNCDQHVQFHATATGKVKHTNPD